MNLGLEPSQMEQWRHKHRFRLFFEERLLDVRDVVSYFMAKVDNTISSVFGMSLKAVKNRGFMAVTLVVIVCLILIFL